MNNRDDNGEGSCFALPRRPVTERDFGPKPQPLTEADPAPEIPEREQLARELYPHLPSRYDVDWELLPTSYARRLLTAVEKTLLPKLVALRHQVNALMQDKHDLCRRLLVAEHRAEQNDKMRMVFERAAAQFEDRCETQDIVLRRMGHQLEAIATAAGMDPAKLGDYAEGLGDVVAIEVRTLTSRQAAIVDAVGAFVDAWNAETNDDMLPDLVENLNRATDAQAGTDLLDRLIHVEADLDQVRRERDQSRAAFMAVYELVSRFAGDPAAKRLAGASLTGPLAGAEVTAE